MEEPRKYRKKPTVIEAIQFGYRPEGGTNSGDVSRFLKVGHSYFPNGAPSGPKAERDGKPCFLIDTPTGEAQVNVGDWIGHQVVNGKDDFWPIAGDIFAATYEPAPVDMKVFAAPLPDNP